MITKEQVDKLSCIIIGCAIEVHKELGAGLLENVYEKCLIEELRLKGLKVMEQVSIPVIYKNVEVNCDLRLDILVDDLIIIELKSVEKLIPIYEAQLYSYMKLLKKPKGILINFNCKNIFHEGQKTLVNEYYKILN